MLPVFGHQNPDTDAITAALVYASFLTRTGTPATAYRLGELNFETPFVLREAGIEAPAMLPEQEAGTTVALVDHNESTQSAPNLAELSVSYVVDHHKLGDLQTSSPALLRFEPVGSCGTILLKLHREANLTVEPLEARLMLSGILSDTLHFRSPTTTDADREAVDFLAPVAGIEDVTDYAMQMFAAKSDLGDTPAEQLLQMDYKEFTFGEGDAAQRWGVGVTETTNPGYVLGRQEELLTAMRDLKQQHGLQGMILSVVDILEEHNETLVASGTEAAALQGAFGVQVADGRADLGSRISRKKQLVPALEDYFAQQH
ncbi:manganese-dependent inorganic pyrophosphatase [Deinococcus sp. Marseille-Q6407]|uniref:manganese-dependent inorganic pyrophosphatase n=1 Tax=Deinococcus sp. Marseille-Q6407 TaxID=2969223 RepID=UPI0021BE54A1|nr:manganese-dependent inorganic pyrophosphatase [Deinococcus sp. Marseille-Q6407]